MRRTFLYVFMKPHNFLNCKDNKYTCCYYPNKRLCDNVEIVINSIIDSYEEKK